MLRQHFYLHVLGNCYKIIKLFKIIFVRILQKICFGLLTEPPTMRSSRIRLTSFEKYGRRALSVVIFLNSGNSAPHKIILRMKCHFANNLLNSS